MVSATRESIKELTLALQQATSGDGKLAASYKNLHRGRPEFVSERFLKARENNVAKALKMILDSLHWRIANDIDSILSRPIGSKEIYDSILESQPIGMTGYCRKGRPVFAIGVGVNGFERVPTHKYIQTHIQINEYRDQVLLPNSSRKVGHFVGTCLKILDMSNLRLSTLSRIKVLTMISTIDDLNYPEKTDTYYIVNTPYIFQACWKVVKPLLHDRTKRKIRVLPGSGKEELLKIMDEDTLPHFCRTDSKHKDRPTETCFSPSHPFHMELWSYIKEQSCMSKCMAPSLQKSFHITVSQPREEIQTIEEQIQSSVAHFGDEGCSEGSSLSFSRLTMADNKDDDD
ncbi:hypothetical protein KP509_17G007900 [Ceratopteris richardii]|uniref:CRAL-TRIO domain-containing protein n=1 Tax=Ceratopteris richardii TaxID=49495 RepID=A0A8T2SVR1_CERRI|nr:hypothetical protein KP509_17G007900 [Ceratopteris richardii]